MAMADYWADLSQLRADGRRVLSWIRRQGVTMCADSAKKDQVAEYLLPVFQAMEDIIRPLPLVAVYLYRQEDQPPGLMTTDGKPMREVDGISWKDVTTDKGELYAIGLSLEAIGRGPEYLRFLFLHELAHIFGGVDHSWRFHRQLDRLIAEFNQRTGGNIVNDRCGIPMRFDSRSYDPFEGIGTPPAPHVGHREFRIDEEEIYGTRNKI